MKEQLLLIKNLTKLVNILHLMRKYTINPEQPILHHRHHRKVVMNLLNITEVIHTLVREPLLLLSLWMKRTSPLIWNLNVMMKMMG